MSNALSRRAALLAFVVPVVAASLATASQLAQAADTVRGSGRVVEESRKLPDFEAVAVAAELDVVVSQSAQGSVRVLADDNLQSLLETVVELHRGKPTLQLRWKRGTAVETRTLPRVQIALPRLSALSIAGGGSVRLERWSTPALQLSIAGSGRIVLAALDSEQLDVRVAGSGEVRGAGRVARLAIGISGSGDVKLGDLTAADVSIKIAGSGDAAVNARKTLAVSIAGHGEVVYTGNAEPTTSIAGSGSVKKKG